MSRAAAPSRDELLSLAERSRHLVHLRLVLAAAVAATAVALPSVVTGPAGALEVAVALYALVSLVTAAATNPRSSAPVAVAILQAGLLIDGIFLVSAIALTGAAASPLWFLLVAHLVATTLLGSYRTGLKIAVWETLLASLVFALIDAGWIDGADLGPPVDRWGPVVGVWAVALATATFAAASERSLRSQRADLASLSAMAARIEERPAAPEIPQILLAELCEVFGFRRGVVVAGRGAGYQVIATTPGIVRQSGPGIDADRSIAHVVADGGPRFVRRIDADADPALAGLLPEARNVAIVPFAAASGLWLGVVVLERGRSRRGLAGWSVAMIERFVAHAALALRNAWLSEEREAQLETIESLERELRAYNSTLEERVEERTLELEETVAILRETDAQRRRLLAHVVRVAEEERQRIANDVHDDPVQKLVALKMRLELLAKEHPADPHVAKAREAVAGALHSMRHLLFDLRPPVLDEAGFDDALRYLLEQSELPFAWSVGGRFEPEPSEQARVILYRIAQEAVVNAKKHSRASRLEARIATVDDRCWMEIADDGIGFLPQEAVVAAPGHLGLASMRERAEMAGGSCTLRSLPGGGTTLEVWIPAGERSAPVTSLSVADARDVASAWRSTRAS